MIQATTDRLMCNVPHAIRDVPGWLLWKLKPRDKRPGEFDKVPYYATTRRARESTQGSNEDIANLVVFDAAMEAFQGGGFDGVGIATLPGHGIVAGDFDAKGGKPLHAEAMDLANTTYAEKSPSGKGIRALWLGSMESKKNNPIGVEVFGSTGFVTITGDVINDLEPVPLPAHVRARLESLAGATSSQRKEAAPAAGATTLVDAGTVRDLRSALNALSADDYHEWIAVGQALSELGDVGRGLWIDWSQTSDKWNPEDARKWRGFTGSQTGYAAVFKKAQAVGWVNPAAKPKDSTPKPWSEWDQVDEMNRSQPQKPHPLALFVDLNEEPMAPRWVIPGFIGHGVTIIAGLRGVGKTTTLLPLAMQVAGMATGSAELAPLHWRHVVYIVEDIEQAQRIVSGLVRYGGLGIEWATVRERLHLVEARRLPPGYVAQVGELYRDKFTRQVDGAGDTGRVSIEPLVVVDTMAATLELESENDNAEVSRAMAALKQGFAALPVWMVGHLPKGIGSRSDLDSLTARGASAFESDANGVLYLIEEGGARFLLRGKTRFEGRWPDLAVTSHFREVMAKNEFGGMEPMGVRWTTIAPPAQTRQEAASDAQEQARKDAQGELRQAIRDAVQIAWQTGHPLNRAGIRAKVPHKHSAVADCIEELLADGWLYEVPVPAKERVHPRKTAFFVNLDTIEHEEFLRDGDLPADKLKIPKSWQKTPVSSVPDENTKTDENQPHEAGSGE